MIWLGYCVAVILFAVDRLLKLFALHSLPPEGVFLISNLLGLQLFKNHGLAFGIPLDRILLLTASIVVITVLAVRVARRRSYYRDLLPMILLVLGAASNFFDRAVYGYVVDYLKIGPISFVNIADGMVILGLLFLLFQRKSGQKK